MAILELLENNLHYETSFDIITVTGPDATSFLQGQLSQDIEKIGIGETLPSLLLSPQGKLISTLRCLHVTKDNYRLYIETNFGSAVYDRLKMFLIRTDVEMQSLHDYRFLRYLSKDRKWLDDFKNSHSDTHNDMSATFSWPRISGIDIVSTDIESQTDKIDSVEIAENIYEVIRISNGIASMKNETLQATIPAAANIVEDYVDFDKGCYVGQELIARIDSRGNKTPKKLITLDSDKTDHYKYVAETEGDIINSITGEKAGSVTSLAELEGTTYALGYVKNR